MFNITHYRNDKNLLDFANSKFITRNAVRAVIIDGNKILMAHLEKTDEYKFPGGGKEENETTDEALTREVLEETGYIVKTIDKKIGTVTEYAKAKEGRNYIFRMISEYYLVSVEPEPLEQRLEEYEKELMFKPCWIEIETAYNTNKKQIERKTDPTLGIKRETLVLEILKDVFKNNMEA